MHLFADCYTNWQSTLSLQSGCNLESVDKMTFKFINVTEQDFSKVFFLLCCIVQSGS